MDNRLNIFTLHKSKEARCFNFKRSNYHHSNNIRKTMSSSSIVPEV